MKPVPPDRLRDVVDAVLEALDDGLDGPAVAARAMLSPFHFHRLVRAGIGEAPAAFRRRLVLERAAWRLGRGATVLEAAHEAGYDAVEAFSRAFARAHGVPPSRFANEPREFRLAAPNAIHFHPPGGLLLPGQPRSDGTMDLSDRLVEHDHWHTVRLLEQAAQLSDEALDRPVKPGHVIHAFEGPEPDVRTMLDRVVFTKEVWTAAIGGREFPGERDRSIAGQQARLAAVQPQFAAIVRRIRDRNEWDDAFVDALCTPPVSFTFGSVIAHIVTVNVVRRQAIVEGLRALGVEDVEIRDPIEWERLLASRR
ncbi:MAG: helix-turn-helix transcriptional regulator [Deltaproteobacteria bacterium]|nr:helix-turn-helix transcriptional regulator [Deltaproteobacteria bacterium]